MDITTAIIGLVMLGIFVVPIAILNAGSKKKALIAELKDLATQNEREIAEHDTGEQFAIGISSTKDQVFFIRKEAKEYQVFKSNIPLKLISDCVLHTQYRDNKSQHSNGKGLEKLEISFKSSSQKLNKTTWLLYDASSDKADNALELGEKWVSVIQKAL